VDAAQAEAERVRAERQLDAAGVRCTERGDWVQDVKAV
jgi:hypothetical protein